MLAKTIHIDHDTLYAQLHFKLCNKTGVKLDNEHWYDYVETNGEAKVNVLLNQQVQTCRTIPNNKPAILVRDNEKGTCMLIDVAVFGDRNVIKIEAETILIYRDLIIESQCKWNVNAKVIPVIAGATGTVSQSLRQYLNSMSR